MTEIVRSTDTSTRDHLKLMARILLVDLVHPGRLHLRLDVVTLVARVVHGIVGQVVDSRVIGCLHQQVQIAKHHGIVMIPLIPLVLSFFCK